MSNSTAISSLCRQGNSLLVLVFLIGFIPVANATKNIKPIANAGDDQTVGFSTSVTLTGQLSTDPDGTITKYRWKQISGPGVTLVGADTATPNFVSPDKLKWKKSVTLLFKLVVTDNRNAIASDTVQVVVQTILPPPSIKLNVSAIGTGTGAVAVDYIGSGGNITCNTTCSYDLPPGTSVHLYTTPGANSTFTSWGGDCTGNAFDCYVTVDAAKSVQATFNIRAEYALTINKTANGAITVLQTGSMPVDCLATDTACSVKILAGNISVTEKPNPGYEFTGWTGVCTGLAATCNFDATQDVQLGASFTAIARSNLNDTGITLCSDGTALANGTCSTEPGQDAESGRDADVATNSNSDGHAGFSFVKIDNNGQALAANDPAASCVKDKVTGLLWEVKTDDGGLHDKDWKYSWYDSRLAAGPAGTPSTMSADCGSTSVCDTDGYVRAVNTAGLCGVSTGWRLPTINELRSIVSYDRTLPAVDIDYFPNTVADGIFWSTISYVYPYMTNVPPGVVLPSNALIVNFDTGSNSYSAKGALHHVRLVYSGQ